MCVCVTCGKIQKLLVENVEQMALHVSHVRILTDVESLQCALKPHVAVDP